MCVEIIFNQNNLFGVRVCRGYFLGKHRPILCCLCLRYIRHSPSSQRFACQQDIACSHAAILIVYPLGPPRTHGLYFPYIFKQLTRHFVVTNDRKFFIIRSLINIKNTFHICDKRRTFLRRNYPLLLLPGLEFVFFRTCRTVSCDTDSTYSSSTILSASKRKLHCECPSGGSPQLKAIKCASKSPSVCLERPPPCGRLNTPDIPFSKKRLRTRCTRNLPTFKNPPIISSDCFFPSDSSQLSSINASNTCRALRFPLDTIWFSSRFSSSVKQKRYFASAISNLH